MQFLQNYNARFYWLLVATAVILFFRLGAAPIYILDEAKNAQCAREMWHSGNWIVPTFNGLLRTDKPALHYWFMILAYNLFGVTPFAARFFSALFGLATIILIYRFASRHKNAETGFFTALALALSTHFLFEFRLAVPDPYLIFFTTLGLCSGYNFFHYQKLYWLLLSAAALALATLAKGPVALALPGLALLLFLIITKRWKQLLDGRLLAAALLYLALVVPWYYAVHKATNGGFTKGFFLEHNLNRFSDEMEGHGGFFGLTIIIAFVGMLPLSVAVFSIFQKKWRLLKEPPFVFALIITGLYLLFFTISSTKLPNYAMPCYPFFAMLLGYYLATIKNNRKNLPTYFKYTLLVISLALPTISFFALRAEAAVAHLAWLGLLLLVLPLGLVLAFFLPKNQKLFNWLPLFTLSYILFNVIFLAIAYPTIYAQNPVTAINPILKKGKNFVLAYKIYNPAFNFNAGNPEFKIPVFQSADSLLRYVTSSGNTENTYILTRQDLRNDLDSTHFKLITQQKDLFELPTTVLLKWHP